MGMRAQSMASRAQDRGPRTAFPEGDDAQHALLSPNDIPPGISENETSNKKRAYINSAMLNVPQELRHAKQLRGTFGDFDSHTHLYCIPTVWALRGFGRTQQVRGNSSFPARLALRTARCGENTVMKELLHAVKPRRASHRRVACFQSTENDALWIVHVRKQLHQISNTVLCCMVFEWIWSSTGQ